MAANPRFKWVGPMYISEGFSISHEVAPTPKKNYITLLEDVKINKLEPIAVADPWTS